ncbi:class I SAM-dependent methyltransferase [Kitasatospora sp. NPDC058965]|uniref:class I SAM-dependent methyltransferase n=1 Tax=Kitasatospora sp. NPDC058965 TaxID=3346682 RepID=UPI00369B10EE
MTAPRPTTAPLPRTGPPPTPASARPGTPPRSSGVREVLRYNWPRYAAGCLTAAGGWALAPRLPGPAARLVRTGSLLATAWLASSTLATWRVYDRSDLQSYGWLGELLPAGPGDHLVVSAGLDETSRPVAAHHPGAPQRIVDLYDPALTTEGSIRRARRRVPPAPGTVPGRPDRLPVPDGALDTVLAVFAAHELRDRADRLALFTECARALRPGGTLLLVEHLRDAANIAVYGPGAWHFLPRAEWLRLAAAADLTVVTERRLAGLVTAFALRKAD